MCIRDSYYLPAEKSLYEMIITYFINWEFFSLYNVPKMHNICSTSSSLLGNEKTACMPPTVFVSYEFYNESYELFNGSTFNIADIEQVRYALILTSKTTNT